MDGGVGGRGTCERVRDSEAFELEDEEGREAPDFHPPVSLAEVFAGGAVPGVLSREGLTRCECIETGGEEDGLGWWGWWGVGRRRGGAIGGCNLDDRDCANILRTDLLSCEGEREGIV